MLIMLKIRMKPMEPDAVGSMNYLDADNGFLFRYLKGQLI
jgi:hypothetical protein